MVESFDSAQDKAEDKILKNYQNKQTFLRIIYAAIILASGILIGAGGTVLLAKNGVIWIEHKHKTPSEITNEITEKYGLNSEQKAKVETIINKAFEQRKADENEISQKRDAYLQVVIAEMKDVLTPEQFDRWSKDFQTLREKMKNRKR